MVPQHRQCVCQSWPLIPCWPVSMGSCPTSPGVLISHPGPHVASVVMCAQAPLAATGPRPPCFCHLGLCRRSGQVCARHVHHVPLCWALSNVFLTLRLGQGLGRSHRAAALLITSHWGTCSYITSGTFLISNILNSTVLGPPQLQTPTGLTPAPPSPQHQNPTHRLSEMGRARVT